MLFKHGMDNITKQTNIQVEFFTWVTALLTNVSIVAGLFAYVASTGVWLLVLTKTELSKAYPFIGLGVVGTMLFGYWLFNEPLTTQKLAGTAMVVAGIILLAK